MSTPITYCAVVLATKSEEGYQRFKNAMVANFKHGGFTQLPCKHDPPCEELSEEVIATLNKRLEVDLTKELPPRLPHLSLHKDERKPRYKKTWS